MILKLRCQKSEKNKCLTSIYEEVQDPIQLKTVENESYAQVKNDPIYAEIPNTVEQGVYQSFTKLNLIEKVAQESLQQKDKIICSENEAYQVPSIHIT